MFLIIVTIQSVLALLSVPSAISWASFNIETKILSFTYPIYSSTSVYTVKYQNDSTTYYLPSHTKTTASIYCYSIDGTPLTISYKVTVGTDSSDFSSPVSLLCAGVPDGVSTISFTNNLKKLILKWTEPSNNGSPIQGYRIKRFLNTWEIVGTTDSTVLTFTDTIAYDTQYNYTIYAYNQVGESTSSDNIMVYIEQEATAEDSIIVPPESMLAGYEAEFIVKLFDSGGNPVKNPGLMILEVRDVCSIKSGYECIRVGSDSSLYMRDLMEGFEYVLFEDNEDETMSAFYTPLLTGNYTFSVIQLQPSGILADFWDNIWFQSPLDSSSLFSNFSLNYPDNTLITTYSSEYVSMKLFTFLYIPNSGNYTFYIIADDYFKFYVNGILIYQSTTCCVEETFSYTFSTSSYFFIQLELIQLDSSCSLSVYWSSDNFNKTLIPPSNLLWPKRVQNSPWTQEVDIGLSSVSNSYFEGYNKIVAGELYLFKFYSIDHKDTIVDNTDDIFALEFEGPENYYFVSTYAQNGLSYIYARLGIIGNYTSNVLLYGEHIKGSPFEVEVNKGYPSVTYSYVEEVNNVTVGEVNLLKVYLIDFFGNPTDGGQVSMKIEWDNSDDYKSPIGVVDADQDHFGFNQSGDYIDGYLEFSVFIAGNYKASIFLDRFLIQTFQFDAFPAEIYPGHCIGVFNNFEAIAGSSFSFQVQTRDRFFNNLLIDNLKDFILKAFGASDIVGYITVSSGIIQANFTTTVSGEYEIIFNISGQTVNGLSNFTYIPSEISYLTSTLTMGTSSVTGTKFFVYINTQDEYSNTLTGGLKLDYSIISKSAISGTISDCLNGTYILEFTPYIVDTYSVSVNYNSNYIGNGGTVIVSNSNVKGLTSTFASINSVVASKGTLTITSKDVGGNTVNNPVNSVFMGSQYYYVNISGNQNMTILATFTDLTAYRISLRNLNITGTYSVTLALMEEGGLNGFYFKDNSWEGLYQNLDYHNHKGYTPSYYTKKDPNLNLDFSLLDYPDFCSAYWTGTIMTSTTATYTFYIETDNKARVTINDTVIIDNISKSTTSGTAQLTSTIFYPIRVDYKNGGNNGYLRLKWSSPSFSKTIIPTSVFYSEILSELSPYTLTVTPDTTLTRMCYTSRYTDDPDSMSRAYVKTLKNFNIYSRDTFGNQVTTTNDVYVATLTLGTTTVTVTIVNESGGKYKGSFTATLPGTYTLRVSLRVNNILNLVNSTYVNVLTGPTDATKTTLVNTPTSTVAGTEAGFIIVASDSAGTQQIKGGDSVSVTMKSGELSVPTTQISVVDNDDGTYSTNFIIYVTGDYNISIYMNTILATSFNLTVTVSTISLSKSTISIPSPNTFGSTISCDVYIKDIYSNAYNILVPVFVYATKETNSNFMPLKFTITTKNLSLGNYVGTADFTLKNVDRSQLCSLDNVTNECNFVGSLTVRGGVFDSKLLGKYYSNSYLTGTEVLRQREGTVSFSWTQTAYNIDVSSFSASWEGFLRPATSKSYTIYITANDWADVYLDGSNILNGTSSSVTLNLVSGQYHTLQITMNNTDTLAEVSFEWLDTTRIIVPSSVLFYYLDETFISDSLLSYETVSTSSE